MTFCYRKFYRVPISTQTPTSSNRRYNPALDEKFLQAEKLRDSGDLSKAVYAFDKLASVARKSGNTRAEATALLAKGGSQLRQFAYHDAAQTYYRVIVLARKIPDRRLLGAVYVNLAEIHVQLADLQAAGQEASTAVEILRRQSDLHDLIRAELQLGVIQGRMNRGMEAQDSFRQAIQLAYETADWDGEALAWLMFGQERTRSKDLSGATAALYESYRLSVIHRLPILDALRINLAGLELQKGHAAEALRRLDQVLTARSPIEMGLADYEVAFQRAKILAALHRGPEALAEYRGAVAAATKWRNSALPGEIANASSVEAIHSIYAEASDFMAAEALSNGNSRLAGEALSVLAVNRAADLREQRTLALHRSGQLPPRYYQLLDELRAAETKAVFSGTAHFDVERNIARIRADLAVLETEIAVQTGAIGETFHPFRGLLDIQCALTPNDALLSFSVGRRRSWLWIVTRSTIELESLPDEATLEGYSQKWASNVRVGVDATASGKDFASILFSKASSAALRKRNWLVVSDTSLFRSAPIAALPDLTGGCMQTVARNECVLEPIIARHTVRYVTNDLLPARRTSTADLQPFFAGLGDPVYNMADPRAVAPANVFISPNREPHFTSPLARLVGSGNEIRISAQSFYSSEILTGTLAVPGRVPGLLKKKPAVLHFAAHVVSSPGLPENAAVALSLGPEHLPQLLTSELVTTYQVPGTLVVLSGCNSQQGKPVPGVGVKGLSRAWLLAGASAVITSTWPMPDDNGKFFALFYQGLIRNWKAAIPLSELAATALAHAQNEIRFQPGFRREPAFWAAYTVISKE